MDRNVNMKSMDSEREKFRTYIEKTGVMSALTDVLVQLYEEPNKPSDAVSYIKAALSSSNTDDILVQMYEEKVKEQQTKIEVLEQEIKTLRETLLQKEGNQEASGAVAEEVTNKPAQAFPE